MNFRLFFFLLALYSCSSLTSCNDSGNLREVQLPEEIRALFQSMYPDARLEEADYEDGYFVVEFSRGRTDSEAWFKEGEWVMTETDLDYKSLPQAVKAAFETGKFFSWKVDDVEQLERKGMEPVYVLEIEQKATEVELYYTASGLLVKDQLSSHKGHLPKEVPAEVQRTLNEMFPSARVLETDVENGYYEIDILDQGVKKEVLFSHSCAWLSTSWDVSVRSLPQAVRQFAEQHYSEYHIDDAEYYESVDGNFYELELENKSDELIIKVTPQGNLID